MSKASREALDLLRATELPINIEIFRHDDKGLYYLQLVKQEIIDIVEQCIADNMELPFVIAPGHDSVTVIIKKR